MTSLIVRFLRRPAADRRLLLEACGQLLVARLALAVLPTTRLAVMLERPPAGVPRPADPPAVERRVAWAINAAAARSPVPMVCFPRAIAARAMLARRGIAVRLLYGVAKTAAGYEAHVWVEGRNGPILGEREAAGFTVVHVFEPGGVAADPDHHPSQAARS